MAQSVYIAKGYKPYYFQGFLASRRSCTEALSEFLRAQKLVSRTFENHTVGPIEIVLFADQIPGGQAAVVLLDQIEGVMTAAEPRPNDFSGQRSPLFTLESSYQLPMFSDTDRRADSLQLKGFLYRPLYGQGSCFPIMRQYSGIGGTDAYRIVKPDGLISVEPPTDRPYAALSRDAMKYEAATCLLMARKVGSVTPPLGFGVFQNVKYTERTGDQVLTGFTIHQVEGVNRIRGFDLINALIRRGHSGSILRQMAEMIFKASGELLGQYHENGLIHSYFHFDNVSFLLGENGSITMPRTHDFEAVVWRRDISAQAFFTSALIDLLEFQFFFYIAPVFYPFLVASTASAELPEHYLRPGVSLKESRIAFRSDQDRFRAIMNPSVRNAWPVRRFFEGYFGPLATVLGIPQQLVGGICDSAYNLIGDYMFTEGKTLKDVDSVARWEFLLAMFPLALRQKLQAVGQI